MFATEVIKLRSLPTPRWSAAICFGLTLIVALIVLATDPSDPSVYRDVPIGPAQLFTMVVSIVLGAWVFGVEFSQGTLRRVLTSEPRRSVVLAVKALVVAVGTAAFAAALMAFAGLLTIAVTSINSVAINTADAFNLVPSMAIQSPLVALMAGALTLLFRSYAGGMIATLALILVIDGILGIWAAIRDYTFGVSLSSIEAVFDSTPSEPVHSLGISVLIALAWVAAIAAPGVYRFVRGDFK